MRFLKGILLALIISITTWLGGCEDDEDVEEPPVVREVAGESAAGEEVAGEEVAGESAAGEDIPLDQGVLSAGEMVDDQDVPGGEQSEDCAPESEAGEECDETQPAVDPACEPDSLEAGEECDDNVDPESEEDSSGE